MVSRSRLAIDEKKRMRFVEDVVWLSHCMSRVLFLLWLSQSLFNCSFAVVWVGREGGREGASVKAPAIRFVRSTEH